MKNVPFSAAICGLLLAGCTNQQLQPGGVGKTLESRGLSVTLETPKRDFTVGERFVAVVTARNMSNQPITINAPTQADVIIRLYAQTALYMQEIKRYPRATIAVPRTWSLAPGQSRSFHLPLVVEPDWPRQEALQLSAQINGRADVEPALTIVVQPATPDPVAEPTEPAADAASE